jgi:hypothetical protein
MQLLFQGGLKSGKKQVHFSDMIKGMEVEQSMLLSGKDTIINSGRFEIWEREGKERRSGLLTG